MATFTAWTKIRSTKYFCNARVAGLGEIFVQQKHLAIAMVVYISNSHTSMGYLPMLLLRWSGEEFLCILLTQLLGHAAVHL